MKQSKKKYSTITQEKLARKKLLDESTMSIGSLADRMGYNRITITNWLECRQGKKRQVSKFTARKIKLFLENFILQREWNRSILLEYGWKKGGQIIDQNRLT